VLHKKCKRRTEIVKKMENKIFSVCHVNIYFSSCYIFDEVTKK